MIIYKKRTILNRKRSNKRHVYLHYRWFKKKKKKKRKEKKRKKEDPFPHYAYDIDKTIRKKLFPFYTIIIYNDDEYLQPDHSSISPRNSVTLEKKEHG